MTLSLRRLSARIGAVIEGVRLGGDIDDASAAAIRQALVTHKVIFFRGQTHLDDEGQEAFAARLGTPEAHPTIPAHSGKFLFELDSKYNGIANSWHSDSTYVLSYPWATVLRAVQLPSVGGDTLWASMAAAYAHLPEPLRQFADHLWTVHSNDFDYGSTRPDLSQGEIDGMLEMILAKVFEAEHPLVRVHPDTGERCLVLGHFFKKFKGLSQTDSIRFYAIFQEHATKPENTLRWSWQAGDVAIWDNRSTQHYAVYDYDERRIMRRVTLSGDVPVSISGEPSRQIKPAWAELSAAAE